MSHLFVDNFFELAVVESKTLLLPQELQ